jgi:hypothetical protein
MLPLNFVICRPEIIILYYHEKKNCSRQLENEQNFR